jgi:hypothetical protein
MLCPIRLATVAASSERLGMFGGGGSWFFFVSFASESLSDRLRIAQLSFPSFDHYFDESITSP